MLPRRNRPRWLRTCSRQGTRCPMGTYGRSRTRKTIITPTGISSSEDGARLPELLEQARSSDWYTGAIGWMLGDVVEYEHPVACRGMQGLWRPDAATLAMCEQQEKGGEQR